jgi:hypothetical protein
VDAASVQKEDFPRFRFGEFWMRVPRDTICLEAQRELGYTKNHYLVMLHPFRA